MGGNRPVSIEMVVVFPNEGQIGRRGVIKGGSGEVRRSRTRAVLTQQTETGVAPHLEVKTLNGDLTALVLLPEAPSDKGVLTAVVLRLDLAAHLSHVSILSIQKGIRLSRLLWLTAERLGGSTAEEVSDVDSDLDLQHWRKKRGGLGTPNSVGKTASR